MTVVGIDRYQKLRNACQTASEFVRSWQDPAFASRVESEAGVKNVDEIARILRKSFGAATPAALGF